MDDELLETGMPDAQPVDPHADAITARYAAAAVASTGCDPSACDPESATFGAAQYAADELGDGTVPSLGCGNPLRVADLRAGETVLDLGSGAGLDLLISSGRVGAAGRVIGLDMTPDMVGLARRNTAAAGNVEVRLGRIEHIPLPDASVDVVISNCVLNLTADKGVVLREVARVLRPGGRIGISDLLASPHADPDQLTVAAADIGTGVRPLTAAAYEELLRAAGLIEVRIEPAQAAGGGIVTAIVQAVKPTVAIRAMSG
jgi:SAM-dependent methyltransferase